MLLCFLHFMIWNNLKIGVWRVTHLTGKIGKRKIPIFSTWLWHRSCQAFTVHSPHTVCYVAKGFSFFRFLVDYFSVTNNLLFFWLWIADINYLILNWTELKLICMPGISITEDLDNVVILMEDEFSNFTYSLFKCRHFISE